MINKNGEFCQDEQGVITLEDKDLQKEKNDSARAEGSEVKPAGGDNGAAPDIIKEGEAAAEKKEQLSPEEQLRRQLAEKTKEAAEFFDKWLRLRAEFENFKKRMQKEKADLLKFGNESLLRALLPVLDNLTRALDHGKEKGGQASSLLEGVELIHKQFINILEKFGVKPVSAVGELFDPEKHEAIAQEESDQEPNKVIGEVEKGYLYHERLLRPAKVIVAKPKGEKREGA